MLDSWNGANDWPTNPCRWCGLQTYSRKQGGGIHPHWGLRCLNALCPHNSNTLAIRTGVTTDPRPATAQGQKRKQPQQQGWQKSQRGWGNSSAGGGWQSSWSGWDNNSAGGGWQGGGGSSSSSQALLAPAVAPVAATPAVAPVAASVAATPAVAPGVAPFPFPPPPPLTGPTAEQMLVALLQSAGARPKLPQAKAKAKPQVVAPPHSVAVLPKAMPAPKRGRSVAKAPIPAPRPPATGQSLCC